MIERSRPRLRNRDFSLVVLQYNFSSQRRLSRQFSLVASVFLKDVFFSALRELSHRIRNRKTVKSLESLNSVDNGCLRNRDGRGAVDEHVPLWYWLLRSQRDRGMNDYGVSEVGNLRHFSLV